jgi:hypothetical protein
MNKHCAECEHSDFWFAFQDEPSGVSCAKGHNITWDNYNENEHGWLVTGGPDIYPEIFKEAKDACKDFDLDYDKLARNLNLERFINALLNENW